MAGDRLFTNMDMSQVTATCEEVAMKAAEKFSEERLATNSTVQLVEYIVADKVPPLLRLDVAHHEITGEVVTLSARQGLAYGGIIMPSAGRPASEGLMLRLHIPYSGTQQAFMYRPSRMLQHPPEAMLTDREVILSVVDASFDRALVEKHLLDQEQNLLAWVDSLNTDLERLERQIRSMVSARLSQRRTLLQQRNGLLASLTIPVRHVQPDRALEVPVKRTRAALTPAASPQARDPEWTLADAVYEQMIRTVTSFGHALERRPASALQLIPDEETLRDWLLFLLNANYEGADGGELFVGGETINGRGKTDILVRHQDLNAFIGECKFWDGPKKFNEAIDQLLDYTVWRDTKAAIILFIRRRNATAAIDAAGGCLTQHVQCTQAPIPVNCDQRRDYRFASPHDEQRMISLALLPIVVTETGRRSG
jgi:hypothetical protein